jgi:type 2 lantibiotic biosynthesis protein LanM
VPHPVFQEPAWYHALTLTERLASLRACEPRPDVPVNADLAQRRLRRWQAQPPFPTNSSYFGQRLALDGLSEADLCYLLGEPIEAVRDRHAVPPDWLLELAEAFARSPSSGPLPVPETMREQPTVGFLDAIEPLLSRGRDRVRAGVKALTQSHATLPFDPGAVEEILSANLPGQLLRMLGGTMALELHVARLQGLLKGATPEERFQSFLERLRHHDHILALLQEYPVLARQLWLRLAHWAHFCLEFLQHLCADWEAIRTTFSPQTDPGLLVEVDGGVGDLHRGGRSVLIAQFTSGFQVIYKPKTLAVDGHFQELLTWLNERGDHPPFRTLTLLNRGSYGWVEFIAAQTCPSTAEVRRFYQRQGGYLALLYTLEATDFHFENLIAAGEHPVLVDLEALFHPRGQNKTAAEADLLAEQALTYSVQRVGLLPRRQGAAGAFEGIDLSGLGAERRQLSLKPVPYWEDAGKDEMRLSRKRMAMREGQHRPSLGGQEVNVLDYAEDITAGFTAIYRLLLKHRESLLAADGPLAHFAEDEVRAILRPTQAYALLLRESFHPDLLRSALDRDRFFDWLWVKLASRPELIQVLQAEWEDLHNGDVPLFTTRPASRHIWTSRNERVADFFDESGVDLVRRRVQQMSDEDLARQLWFIRASLATLPGDTVPTPTPTAGLFPPRESADREQLVAAARTIGDRLEALALQGAREVTWIGLALGDERQGSLQPLGLDLYDGLPGVVLFLAYLGACTGEDRYTILAHGALATLRRQVERGQTFFTSLGGFNGWGGVIYAYTHLGTLWRQPALLAEAEALVEQVGPLIERDEHLDVSRGVAGYLGSLLSLYQCAPAAGTHAAMVRCGERLIARLRPMDQGSAWVTPLPALQPLTGFAHGAAGMAWALLRLTALTGEERFRAAARAGIAYERGLFSPLEENWPDLRDLKALGLPGTNGSPRFLAGWCFGAAGIGLARLWTLPHLDDAATRSEIDTALQTTLARGFGANHSLCHGDLGNLELLVQASTTLAQPRWHAEVGRLSARILESIARFGWRCGNSLGVESPGLMTGLAGIGYGLLRLAVPEQVPAVLMLAPPTQSWVKRDEAVSKNAAVFASSCASPTGREG